MARSSPPPTPPNSVPGSGSGDSTVLEGRAWVGERYGPRGPAAVAMAPILSDQDRRVLGFVAVHRL